MKDDGLVCWKDLLKESLRRNKETFEDVESMTLTEEELLQRFDSGYGGSEGVPFTVWTKNHVYFPAVYDGSEWVACVPRNPNGEPTSHVGGG